MSFIKPILSVAPPISTIGPALPPPWLPLIGSTVPTAFADFTTEGAANHYWAKFAQQAGFAAWWSAINGTFTRASTAFYTNSSGFLTQAAVNGIRFDHDPVALTSTGVLREGASTNTAVQSNNIASGVSGGWQDWATGSTTFTTVTTAQNLTGPDGVANSGWTITEVASNNFHGNNNPSQTVVSGTVWSLSCWVQPGTSPFVGIGVSNAAITNVFAALISTSGTITNYTTGTGSIVSSSAVGPWPGNWFRVTVTGSTTGDVTYFPIIAPNPTATNWAKSYNATGNNFGAWGFQIEALSFTTSYISTAAVAVTRSADVFSYPVTFPSGITLLGKIASMEGINSHATLIGDDQDGWYMQPQSGLSNFLVNTTAGGGPSATVANVFGTNKVVVAGGRPGALISANGGVANSNAAYNLFSSSVANLFLGDSSINDAPLYGNLVTFGYWPVAATATQAQTLSTLP